MNVNFILMIFFLTVTLSTNKNNNSFLLQDFKGNKMTKFGTKRTVVALSIATALTSAAANAATFEQYNYSNAKPVKAQATKLEDQKETREATGWLVKLITPSIAQNLNANQTIANQTASIMASQSMVESSIQSMDLNVTIVARTS